MLVLNALREVEWVCEAIGWPWVILGGLWMLAWLCLSLALLWAVLDPAESGETQGTAGGELPAVLRSPNCAKCGTSCQCE